MSISLSNNSYPNAGINMANLQNGQSVSADVTLSATETSLKTAEAVLNAGNTISGEVVAKEGNTITLKMQGGQLLEALLTGNADISVGKNINFEVAKTGTGKIALRPLFANLSSNNAAVSALKAASLPVNNTTLSMTNRMMLEGMSINKNALLDMFKNVSTNSGVSPETIVQMSKLEMPLTEDNVIRFENYRNFEHRITGDIINLSEGLGEVLSEESNRVFSNVLNDNALNDILNVIESDVPGPVVNDSLIMELKDIVNMLNPESLPTDDEGAAINPEGVAVNTEGVAVNTEGAAVNAEGVQSNPESMQANSEGVQINTENASINPKSSQINADLIKMNDNSEGAPKDIISESEIGAEQKTVVTKPSLSNAGTFFETVKNILSDADSLIDKNPAVIDEKTKEIIKEKVAEKLEKLINSDDFNKLFKETVKSQLSLEPKDVAKEGKIDELYERILKTTGKINQVMESLGKGDSAVVRAATNLGDNVNFMNQLNEFVNYVQLPLKMAGENANGELYVYTNKKNLNNNDGNYSALLHLDMEHLGPMDIYVTMRDHSKVNTNFFLESEELLDFIESHIDELTRRLTEKGYDTGVRVSKRSEDESVTPIADEFTKNEEGNYPGTVSKLCFDVRA